MEAADMGPGIPTARGVRGSRPGLILVWAIVLRHGGEMRVCRCERQGTVLWVRLPFERSSGGCDKARRER